MRFVFPVFFFLSSLSVPAERPVLTIESGKSQNILVELYSSEGCSSCPPAEAWISGLKNDPDLWAGKVPVVFHVDYWDRLGWKDPLASPLYTQRQYDYSASWGKSGVYTPGFVVNGDEWRGWSGGGRLPVKGKEDAGNLRATLQNNRLIVTFDGPVTAGARIEAALLGMELNIDVQNGENGGKRLLHDFAALHLSQAPLEKGAVQFELPPTALAKAGALAVWVRDGKTNKILQAAGGWLAPRS